MTRTQVTETTSQKQQPVPIKIKATNIKCRPDSNNVNEEHKQTETSQYCNVPRTSPVIKLQQGNKEWPEPRQDQVQHQ